MEGCKIYKLKSVRIISCEPRIFDFTLPKKEDIWSCNNSYQNNFLSILFIMHKQVWEKDKLNSHKKKVFNWDKINSRANSEGFKVISQFKIRGLSSELYPYREIEDYFNTDYFTSSLDYMIAYALYKDYKVITLQDWHFLNRQSNRRDDVWERCGAEYWVGRALGMGVKVIIDDSNLLKHKTGKRYAIKG